MKKQKINTILITDTRRTIERSFSRFISIISIVALGVSFFAGMNAIAPNMYDTVSKYAQDSNAMDIQIISTAGLTENDLAVIGSVTGVESITGEKFVDGVVKVNGEPVNDIDGSEMTVRAYSLDINKVYAAANGADDPYYMNRPQLVDGSWPTSSNQCLVDASTLSTPDEFKIGSVITLEGDGTDLSSSLQGKDYTIVGIIRTPLYISYDRGNTTVGTGKLGTFVYLPSENFLSEYFSSISIKIAGSENYDTFSEEYQNFIAPYRDYIEQISTDLLAPRISSLKAEYTELVVKSEIEYAEAKADIEQQLANAEEQVKQILDMAANGDRLLLEYKQEYNAKATEAKNALDSGKTEHSAQYALWETKRAEYNEAKETIGKYANADVSLATAKTEYNTAKLQVDSMLTTVEYLEDLVITTRSAMDQFDATQDDTVGQLISRFEQSGLVGQEVDNIISSVKSLMATGTAEEMIAYMEPQLQSFEAKLSASKQELSAAQTTLAEKKAELDKAEELVGKLQQAQVKLDQAQTQLQEAENELTAAGYDIQLGELEVLSQLSDMKNQINTFETNLIIAKDKAPTVEAEFEQAKLQANEELENARNQLDAAKDFLLGLDNAKWYVNDRNECLLGFEEYAQTANRTAAIALLFPWLFFVVAALMCLNTMARMIEEERTRLGTFKALGFTDTEIIGKYLVYAGLASTIGSVAGSFMGFALFPTLAHTAFGILYDLPEMVIKYRFSFALPAILISIVSTVGVTYYTCYNNLKVVPSTLMRPKAPKGGKRVLLEKIPQIWTKLNFTWKVTFRNVFRNLKRFLMATGGVLGCTALLLAAFGLNDSIHQIMDRQFTDDDKIWRYDMQIVLNGSYDTTVAPCEGYEFIKSQASIGTAMLEYMEVFEATNEKGKKPMEIYMLVPEDASAVNSYIALNDAKTGKPLPINSSGAVITDKLAKELGISPGDSIHIIINEGYSVKVPVAGIAENYCFHYVYMTKELYKAVFGINPLYNYVSANLAIPDMEQEQKTLLAKNLMSEYSISAVAFTSQIQDSFQNIMNSINYIVIILIVCAGLLAFIVLYNLSVINITERLREIATIKVLGFDDMEVSSYIFRENVILTVIGTLEGLLFGVIVHRLVLAVAEVDIITFVRDISFMSFLYSVVLSFAFSMTVNLVLHYKLKKIDMVESLKSIE